MKLNSYFLRHPSRT